MPKEKCVNCLMPLFVNPSTGNCSYCGFEQDSKHIAYVRRRQSRHDKEGGNPKSYGADKDYYLKKKHEPI